MGLSDVVVAVLRIPDWAPRRIRQTGAGVFIAIALFAPSALADGLATMVKLEQERIEKIMKPVIDDLLTRDTRVGQGNP